MVGGQDARQNPGFSLRNPDASGLTEFATGITVGYTPTTGVRFCRGTARSGIKARNPCTTRPIESIESLTQKVKTEFPLK